MTVGSETPGERAKKLRGAESQADLARRVSQIRGRKVSQQSIDHFENGRTAEPKFLYDLALALATTPKYLMTGKGPARLQEVTAPHELSPPFHNYPGSEALGTQAQAVPASSGTPGEASVSYGGKEMVEAVLIRQLIEDVAKLKSQIRAINAKIGRRKGAAARPHEVRRR